MVKLWIVSELFFPEESTTAYILTHIAKVLSEKYEVHAVAGTPVYDINTNETELDNVCIHRLKADVINKNDVFARLKRATSLSFKMIKFLKKNVSKDDKILMVTNPVFTTLLLPRWAKRNKIDITLIVHDVFPENAVQAGLIKETSMLYNILKRIFDKSYQSVNKCIVIGRDMREVINQKCKNKVLVEVIENWADTDRILNGSKENHQDKIVLKFSGNLGRVQGLERFLQIFCKVENEDLLLCFAGKGAAENTLKEYVRMNNITNVYFEPAYSRKDEEKVLNDCDISLITLGDSMFGLGVPSKTYNCMAAGKPILYIGPKNSEVDLEIKEKNIGFSFSFTEEEEIVRFLNSLKLSNIEKIRKIGAKSRKCAEKEYSKNEILKKYYKII